MDRAEAGHLPAPLRHTVLFVDGPTASQLPDFPRTRGSVREAGAVVHKGVLLLVVAVVIILDASELGPVESSTAAGCLCVWGEGAV